jgi:hypothetical protein
MAELWGTNFKVVNNTNYTITCSGGVDLNPIIASQEEAEWTETSQTLNLNLAFADENGAYVTANLSYNSNDGVTANRGSVSSPDILLLIQVNGNEEASATLSTNGVQTICVWTAYEDGGNITLTFDQVV